MITSEEQSKYIDEKYNELFPALLKYAKTQLNNPDLAEEAAQETFRIACVKPEELMGSKNPDGWLMETLKNVIKNMKRAVAMARWFEMQISDEMPEPGKRDDYFDIEYSDQEDFKLIRMIARGKMTMVDAAAELGISPEACRKRMQRYREKVFGKIKK